MKMVRSRCPVCGMTINSINTAQADYNMSVHKQFKHSL